MLEKFLSKKPLYYDVIDYSRMPRIYEKIKTNFSNLNIIHLIGTNAKGTTGRFLATALNSLGFNVGHYSSPHILNFNERIWLNGADASDEILEDAHKKLLNILEPNDAEILSYFEYTTLLCMIVFKRCEFVVMEAGLGGEHDATAVFDKILTLVTPIAYDHENFLGSSIREIATTKLNAIQNSAIMAVQKYDEVYEIADKLADLTSLNIYRVSQMLDSDDKKKIIKIAKKLKLANYLVQNLSLSIAALKFLNIAYDEDSFNDAQLFGRLTKIDENIIVDVGHNPLAAQAIVEELKDSKYILIYNSYKDKNYKKILQILKPILKSVEIIEVDDKRVESIELLQNVLNELEIKCTPFNNIDNMNKYLVFGSFSVVESFMKRYLVDE